MRIKTFEAPTVQEALALARRELGSDAVVLNTKHIKTGLLGRHGSDRVALMAAVDDPIVDKQSNSDAKPQTRMAEETDCPVVEAAPAPVAAKLYAQTANIQTVDEGEIARLRAEVRELSAIVRNILASRVGDAVADKPLAELLGIDPELLQGPLGELATIRDSAEMTSALASRLQSFVMQPVVDNREVIVFVGPTGVGKTTTLAKLAAKYAIEMGKTVALVTADTFRIGAVDQLRTYARIMGVPLEIALSPEEVAEGITKHRDKDVVLVDTVGRSHRNPDHLAELKNFVDAASPTQVELVVAASLGREIQVEVVEKFATFSPTQLVVTKLDEAPNRGCLVNLPVRTGLPISCLTAGQNVPQDIDFADAGVIAQLVTEVVVNA